ncbi:acyl-CoA thioesterase II [Afipia sp. 1NLS2]|uniref:acyl-CoA thioesterase II n=1 Tax=Afipia sp. 1NLS2 TaxID=666684 RepID=UPI0001D9E0C9|nr:acyl-CoA thioesterase II [Afipia sp. 1NLS2]EFI53508.1 acyl-CoA thioesterase [Afipia sp. 1NLS2]
MPASLADLISILDLETLGSDRFRGFSPPSGWQRVFGGQVVGQSLVAACRTVEGRLPHSLHAYFILPGDPAVPIEYDVARLRDGGSFSTRRVIASQKGAEIFSMIASFHAHEDSIFEHQAAMPPVPSPDEVRSLDLHQVLDEKQQSEMPNFIRRFFEAEMPFELRPTNLKRYVGEKIDDGHVTIWLKAAKPLPDDPALHMCALAYASDFSLLDASLACYGRTVFENGISGASLDHALWFHRPFRADEWLLYSQDSPNAHDGLGFSRGEIFRADGTLVASVAQEGSVRVRRPKPAG